MTKDEGWMGLDDQPCQRNQHSGRALSVGKVVGLGLVKSPKPRQPRRTTLCLQSWQNLRLIPPCPLPSPPSYHKTQLLPQDEPGCYGSDSWVEEEDCDSVCKRQHDDGKIESLHGSCAKASSAEQEVHVPDLSEEGADLANVRSVGAQDEADEAACKDIDVTVMMVSMQRSCVEFPYTTCYPWDISVSREKQKANHRPVTS